MGPDIALCRRSIVVVLQKKWHIAAAAQKNHVLQLFPPWDFFAFHSFQTLEKPASLARKGLPLFLALTLTFIVTDENIRPQNVAIALLNSSVSRIRCEQIIMGFSNEDFPCKEEASK